MPAAIRAMFLIMYCPSNVGRRGSAPTSCEPVGRAEKQKVGESEEASRKLADPDHAFPDRKRVKTVFCSELVEGDHGERALSQDVDGE